jgi:hypothetical protein
VRLHMYRCAARSLSWIWGASFEAGTLLCNAVHELAVVSRTKLTISRPPSVRISFTLSTRA